MSEQIEFQEPPESENVFNELVEYANKRIAEGMSSAVGKPLTSQTIRELSMKMKEFAEDMEKQSAELASDFKVEFQESLSATCLITKPSRKAASFFAATLARINK